MKPRTKIIAALLLLAVIVGWPVAAHYRAKNKVAAYRRQLIAQGEKLSVAELTPSPPADQDNGAASLMSAYWQAGTLNYTNQPPTMRPVVPGRALVAWRQAVLPTSDSTNVWPGLRDDFEKKSDALDAMREALEKPAIAFSVDYSQGFNVPLSHLAQLKGVAQLLSAATMLELHEGRVTNAVQNLRALTALVSRFKDEVMFISSLVRIADGAIAMNTAWETIQSPDLNEEQLAALQADWESVDFLPQMEAALSMERQMSEKLFIEGRKSPRALLSAMSGGSGASSGLTELMELGKGVLDNPGEGLQAILHRYPGYWAWKWWGSYDDELANMQAVQADIIALREVRKEKCFAPALKRCDQANEEIRKTHSKVGSWYGLGGLSDSLQKALTRLRSIEMQRHLLVTAIALKRHQLRHGKFPASLDALTPGFLHEPPRDPIDGQSMRYRLQDGSFLLYSVGEDGVDNGGDPNPAQVSTTGAARNWLKARDAVWPQPAGAAEVAVLFQKQEEERLAEQRRVAASDGAMTPAQRAFLQRYGPVPNGGSNSSSNSPATNTAK